MQYTYALFLNLEPALEAKVKVIKQQFAETYNHKLSETKPHITVASNELDEAEESALIAQIEKIVSVMRPVKIELSNYNIFKWTDRNTIYIPLTDNKLQGFNLAANKALGKKSQQLHVTIARGLNDATFNKAWPKYANTKFTGACSIHEAVLTRMESNKYKTVHVFKFNSRAPDKTQQAELF